MPGEQQLLVITEPVARTADGESVRVALDVLRGAAQVKVASPASQRELYQTLERRGGRRPVVVGGDAALHGVVQTLHQRRELAGSLLGWIPVVPRHDLARTLGIPAEPAASARVVLAGAERWLDLLVDDAGGVAVNAVRVGAGEHGGAGWGGSGWGGSGWGSGRGWGTARGWGSGRGWATGLIGRAGWRLRVEADDTLLADMGQPVAMVGLGNGADVGGGALAAEARPDDGLAEVVVSELTGRLARLGLGSSARRRGEHVRQEGVQITRARAVTVSGQEFRYDADGVRCGPVRRRTWTVRHSAWRLTVPIPV